MSVIMTDEDAADGNDGDSDEKICIGWSKISHDPKT